MSPPATKSDRPFALPPAAANAASAALAHLAASRFEEAVATLDGLSPLVSLDAGQANLIGRIYLIAGNASKALDLFDSALKSDPSFAEALSNRARALAAIGDIARALQAFDAAFATGWGDPVAYYDHANLLRAENRLPEAIVSYDRALQLRQAYPEALRAGGTVLRDLGNSDAALRFFGEALRLAPNYPDAALDKGNLLLDRQRFDEALQTYDAALSHAPCHALLLTNRGIVLHELGRLPEALRSFDAAVLADPNLPAAHLNRGNVLSRMGRFTAALVSIDAALALSPIYPKAHATRGLLLKMHARFDEAEDALETALAQQPGFTHALTNRGALRLLRGDLERGWPDYEYRLVTDCPPGPRVAPDWAGEPKPGYRLAIFADQGAGDYINFVRYLPPFVKSGLDVTLVCQPKMQRLLQAATRGCRVVDSTKETDRFDGQMKLSSGPFLSKTTLDTIPGASSYLEAEPELVRRWARTLGTDGFKIGLCWRGNQDWRADPNRSVPLRLLMPLARMPGVRLISLQMPNVNDADASTLRDLGVESLGDMFDSGPDAFIDTAAVMANLDLVVACDTSIAHLAGALGRPTFVPLQVVPEWRWMMGIDTSPWYDSVRLFRQEHLGEWDAPIERLCGAVDRMCAGR